jgi:hypothetical protein
MSESYELSQVLKSVLRTAEGKLPDASNPSELCSEIVTYLKSEDVRREKAYAAFEERLQSLSVALQEFLTRDDERKELSRVLVEQRNLIARLQRENAQLRWGSALNNVKELTKDVAVTLDCVTELGSAIRGAIDAIGSLSNSRLISLASMIAPKPKRAIDGAGEALAAARRKLRNLENTIHAIMQSVATASSSADLE